MPSRLTPGRFYGETLRRCEVSDLVLTDQRYAPRLEIPEHSHERAYFCLILQGAYTESCGARTRDCRPLTLLFHPPGEVHADRFHDATGRLFSIEVSPDWLERIGPYAPPPEHPVELQGGAAAWIALRLYDEFQRMDSLSPLAIQGLSLELMAETCRATPGRAESTPPRWLVDVRRRLDAEFTGSPSLEALARAAGVHPMHLVRAFRQQYRCTIGDYVRRARVDFAAGQLALSTAPLAQIARDAGFADQSHFTKAFKQVTGMTPARFRKSADPADPVQPCLSDTRRRAGGVVN